MDPLTKKRLLTGLQRLSLVSGFDIADFFPSYKLLHFLFGSTSKLQRLHQKLDRILDKVVSDHKENLGACKVANEDLLDVLLRLKESGSLEFPITTSNIKAVVMDIFSAGTDTVSATIEWAMAKMMQNTRLMQKAQADVRQALKGKKNICDSDMQMAVVARREKAGHKRKAENTDQWFLIKANW